MLLVQNVNLDIIRISTYIQYVHSTFTTKILTVAAASRRSKDTYRMNRRDKKIKRRLENCLFDVSILHPLKKKQSCSQKEGNVIIIKNREKVSNNKKERNKRKM